MKPKYLAVFALLTLCGVPATAATLQLDGPSTPVLVGSLFTIDVGITAAVDLASYQFDIGYDPLLVQGVLVQEGPFLPSAGATLFVPGAIDDLSGTISFTAGALIGLGSGASGDGVLATLLFRAVSPGSANFTLISPLLYDSIPNPVDISEANGTIVTLDPATVPEPASVFLAGSSLLLLALARRRS
jgi:hypothetical protein